MGCAGSTPVDHEAEQRNAAIEKTLAQDREQMRREIKLLFLGAGESGKSTIMKQFSLAYGKPFTDQERLDYRDVIYDNSLRSMQVVIDAFDMLGIDVPPELNEQVELVMSLGDEPDLAAPTGELLPDVAKALMALWAFEGAREAVDMAHEFQLNDSAPYYFNNIQRLAQPGYIPTDQDILRSRVKSTGITEVQLNIHGTVYRMCDVGGQRSERKKWINCFSDVQVLLFVLAISEYNQMLYEDESVSRIAEATTLWQSIANSKWFHNASIILFLNKIDLFRNKLEMYKLADYLQEYDGPNTYEATTLWLSQHFTRLYENKRRALILHLTCATDTTQIRTVLAAVQEQILANNLLNAGMM
ncbi:heterotrimeric G-protein alpha subunit (G-alpha, GPA1) [Rhodotorula diobovata]|uniref:Heterotrimeric G-protein alpha subunit (G-alpha, GPA1) n=1 Tax=Rhodotorula diobovata TaxID=5288 RepID=A0A5C5FW83_9BASI|nr:heterotrimeric G-protein alpha subunit (G-alpha, GPA1) [Rhodotorula diobovata]